MKKIKIDTMKLNYILFIIAVLPFLTACSSGTNQDASEDEMHKIYKGEKIGFFTDEMDFSEEEALRFWPVYNEFQQKRDSLWKTQRNFLREYKMNETSQNGSDVLKKYLDFDKAKSDLQREYVEKLQKFMTDERILQLFYAEYQFKHFMLNRIRGRHGHREGRGMGRGMGRGQGGRNMDGPQPPL
jgi:hypothetical protein